MQTKFSTNEAIKKCSDCKHEIINCYRTDQQGNTIRLPDNYKPLMSETSMCLEPVVTGRSCDVVSGDYRGKFKDNPFIECPFYEKRRWK
jgi:hypothetical protein